MPNASASQPAPLRALALTGGAIGVGLLSVWARFLARRHGRFVLVENDWLLATLPTWLVIVTACAAMLGALGLLLALLDDSRLRTTLSWCRRWVVTHPAFSALLVVVILGSAANIYEVLYDPLNRKVGWYLYQLRDDLGAWFALLATLCGALALSAGLPQDTKLAETLARWLRRQRRILWAVALGVPLVLGGAMCLWALDGIPHFSDSLTYLMQGRILYTGKLALTAPRHPELFQKSLFFLVTDDRFYGKYPIGWPAIVGTFDHLRLLWLANAALVALAALLTGLVARQFANRRIALLAALLLGLSPWAWFNGAALASHVASTCAVLGFLWLTLRTIKQDFQSSTVPGTPAFPALVLSALGAGLALGAGVLIRPGDAVNFALPVIPVVFYLMWHRPARWLVLGPVIAGGALVGVAIYLWCNSQTTGHALVSPYALENRWSEDWNPTWKSMLARFVFQWQQLNVRFPGWGLGGMTVAVLGLFVALRQAGHTVGATTKPKFGLWLLLAATAIFFGFNTAFGFTNVWWGPRWLFPVAPLLAILWAYVVEALLRQAKPQGEQVHAAAQLALLILLSGMAVGLVCRYGGQFYSHRIMPPHSVSAAVQRKVTALGLHQAVVAMPFSGRRAPLDVRSGLAFMSVPLATNDVIYVRAVPDWLRLVVEDFPDRHLYEVVLSADESSGFKIHELPTGAGSSRP